MFVGKMRLKELVHGNKNIRKLKDHLEFGEYFTKKL